jgi:NAD(P)-dependent dehydrogenase (short-subunit alcohol dehydrogenase family)
MDLRGARVLLTGATGGIGRTLAVELATRGGEVVFTGRRTDVLEPLAEKVGGRAIAADLANSVNLLPGALPVRNYRCLTRNSHGTPRTIKTGPLRRRRDKYRRNHHSYRSDTL